MNDFGRRFPMVITSLVLMLSAGPALAQSTDPPAREVASFQRFDYDDGGSDDRVNAYLLAYLARIVNDGRLGYDLGDLGRVDTPDEFALEFEQRTAHFFTGREEPEPPAAPALPDPPCTGPGCPCHLYQVSQEARSQPARRARALVTASTPVATRSLGNGYARTVRAPVAGAKRAILSSPDLRPGRGRQAEPSCEREKTRHAARVRAAQTVYDRRFDAYDRERALWESERAEMQFFHREVSGFDPEVMLISTSDGIIVVFRGTDRIASAQTAAWYEWGEWVQTDLNYQMVEPGAGMRGKVHRGFWNNLSLVREPLADAIEEAGGQTRPVWVTGHSLGGAQAQLFAAYLSAARGIDPRGVYVYGAPHVGDQDFVAEMEGMFPELRLQRFEFMDDAATGVPLYTMGFWRAGTRNHFAGLSASSFSFNTTERLPVLDFPFNGCHHHTEWYVWATFNRLSPADQQRVPGPPPYPTVSDPACSAAEVAAITAS